jgi:hypothetical protein
LLRVKYPKKKRLLRPRERPLSKPSRSTTNSSRMVKPPKNPSQASAASKKHQPPSPLFHPRKKNAS